MNKKTYILISAALLALFSCAPTKAFAASIYFDSSRSAIAVGDTTVVTVKLNSEGVSFNAVDGAVAVGQKNAAFHVKGLSVAGSALSLWPRTPSLSTDGGVISFTGGIPGGLNQNGVVLFKVAIEATKVGTIEISAHDISVLLNDGLGTKASPQSKSFVITVGPKRIQGSLTNDWDASITGDVQPPAPFYITIGQDEGIFSGKRFIAFNTTDAQSGVDRYEVSENGEAFVRSGSPYVLQNQNGAVSVRVLAYDKAGNKTLAQYSENQSSWKSLLFAVIAVGIVFLVYLWWVSKKKYA
jgi:hypothetical protein